MDEKEITALAEKVKSGTATKEEVLAFQKELNRLLLEIKNILEE
ncbi:MAG: hypothetical protein WDK96_00880 [Candidatus Paceibacterota bacterium]|jgi:hypothetical protein